MTREDSRRRGKMQRPPARPVSKKPPHTLPHTPPPLTVRACLNLERDEAVAVMHIYHDAFPLEQRVADAALLQLVPRGVHESGGRLFHLAERRLDESPVVSAAGSATPGVRAETVGFAVGLHVSPHRLAYIAYIAVQREWRGRGVGTALFRSLVAAWSEARPSPPHWVFLEVERPELAASTEDRARRLRRLHFYERLGCRRIHADFQAPPLGPGLPVVPYWILVLPFQDADLGQSAMRTALTELYREVYGIEEDHPLVVNCLQSLRL